MDILDSNGNTPAHIAAISHQRNALQSLFNHGANRSIKNEAGLIPEAAGFIIEALKDISRGDSKSLKYRLQPAHYLFRRRNDADNDGNTLLHHAVKNRCGSCIDVLLERRANPFIKNKMGKTPAELAASMEYFELLEKLSSLHVLKGLDDQDTEGNTPLHRAVKSGRIDCTDVLLKRKANPFIKNKMGKTPGELAANSGYFALANKLHSSSFLSAGRLSVQLKAGSFNQHSLKLGGSMTPKKGYCP
jgi:ankyrin repeat protein